MRYPWPVAGPGRATRGRPTLQTSSNHHDLNRLTKTPVTNVVNPSPKTTIISEKALRLTTFVTTDQKSTQKTPWIDDVCNNTPPATLQRHSVAGVEGAGGTGGPGCGTHGRRQGLAKRPVSGRRYKRQHTRSHWCGGRRRDRRARLRCPWAAAEPGRTTSGRPTLQTSAHQVPLVWRAPEGPEGQTAVPVGGGGAWPDNEPTHRATRQYTRPHWCGGRRRDLPRCRWAAAGPGQALSRRTQPHASDPAPLAWRAPEGPEGTGGLRDRPLRAAGSRVAISRAAGPDDARNTSGATSNNTRRGRLAGGPPPTGTHSGRALRRPEHPWGHNETRPRPVARPRPRHAHAAPFTTAPPAIRRSCPRDPRPRRGQPRGGRRGRGTGSRTRSRHPRCGRSGSTAGRHRAHHTRRA